MKRSRFGLRSVAWMATLIAGGVAGFAQGAEAPSEPAPEEPDLLSAFSDVDVELHGFLDARYGQRTENTKLEDGRTLSEVRLQLDSVTYFDWAEFHLRGDLIYDDLASDRDHVDLETGEGFADLREANALFSPAEWLDLKIGRQILTWGTGDLLFVNDLFPKDWNAFLLGRDEEYLKAPSDALFASFFADLGNLDVCYVPSFDADRYVDGSRLVYWNPMMQSLAGQNAPIEADRRNRWFRDDEIALRLYRTISGYEAALYAYSGFWKSPEGYDPVRNQAYFPRLNAYGASVRGDLLGGIFNLEGGYYDSREDGGGDDPFIPNSQARFLVGYEHELTKDFTAGVQYYVEWMMDHGEYADSMRDLLGSTDTARDALRHVLTLRLTKLALNQNLILGLFIFYSPSENDAYFRPNVTYKISDHWSVSLFGNFFAGKDKHTFFGQFTQNSNAGLSLRYGF